MGLGFGLKRRRSSGSAGFSNANVGLGVEVSDDSDRADGEARTPMAALEQICYLSGRRDLHNADWKFLGVKKPQRRCDICGRKKSPTAVGDLCTPAGMALEV